MNTTKKILFPLTVALSGLIAVSMYTFADDMQMNGTDQQMQRPQFGSGNMMSGGMMKGSDRRQGGDDVLGQLQPLVSSGLTDDQQVTLSGMIDTYKSDTKAVMETYSGTAITSGQREEMFTQMKTLKLNFLSSVSSYISSDKTDEYNNLIIKITDSKFSDMRQGMPNMRNGGKKPAGSGNVNEGNKKSDNSANGNSFTYIKGDTYTAVNNKLDTFSSDVLTALLEKLNTVISNTTNEKALGIYGELKTMIDSKLSTDLSDEESLLNELLN